ncbi:MAG: PilZ domain-containing protein [Deltaproteobacteria bacterium]|nr:PilZ domain-containing protein [Deltaproteobacteria bacterium]
MSLANDSAADGSALNPQRRRSSRIVLEAIVHYQIDGSEFINLSSNVSSQGIFIKNFSPPPVGTELRIKVQLPQDLGGVAVLLFGKVVRVVDGVGVDDRGMGVEFVSILADTQSAIKFFVNEIYDFVDLDQLETSKDEKTNKFKYTPGPEDTLRLQSDRVATNFLAHDQAEFAGQKLLRSILLVLVGILLGGGIVFLFFLVS